MAAAQVVEVAGGGLCAFLHPAGALLEGPLDVLGGDRFTPHLQPVGRGGGLGHHDPEDHVQDEAEAQEEEREVNEAQDQRVEAEVGGHPAQYAAHPPVVGVAEQALAATRGRPGSRGGLLVHEGTGLLGDVLGLAEHADHVVHLGGGHHLASVQPFLEQFGHAGLDVGHDLVAAFAAGELGPQGGEVALQRFVGILLHMEDGATDVGGEGLFHRCAFLRVVFFTACDSSSQVWSSSVRNFWPTGVSL